jgi:hypothetical protein
MDNEVCALTVYNNKLLAGGLFNTAGNKVSARLAVWSKLDPTDVDDNENPILPRAFSLVQNYPNPFNPTTSIEYHVPTRAHVAMGIYNPLGQLVRMLVDEVKGPGDYRIDWNGTDATGKRVSTGVYLYRFKAGEYVEVKKMVLLK